jgi:hypothetical protein
MDLVITILIVSSHLCLGLLSSFPLTFLQSKFHMHFISTPHLNPKEEEDIKKVNLVPCHEDLLGQ